ncbi:MAG: hypothetical protein ABDH28_05315 [Brevinematia bacterium]
MKAVEYVLYFLMLGLFTFAPFDIALNLNILGFNFRMVGLFLLSFILVGGYVILRNFGKTVLVFPLWLVFLVGAVLINTVFVFNSILILRGVMYALWFWLFVLLVFVFLNLSRSLDVNIVLKLYILSFVIHALFGIVQQVGFYLFGINIFMAQPGRMNGFTYEPSYFVTYLSPVVILILLYSLFLDPKDLKRNLPYYLSVGIIASALFFSTSKLVLIVLVLVLLFIVLFFALIPFKGGIKSFVLQIGRNMVMVVVSFVVIFGITGFLIGTLPYYLYQGSQIDDRITLEKKISEISESREETSFGPRLEEFKKTMKVAIENPIVGTSLGGVAPHKAVRAGVSPRNNQDVKPFEGMCVYAELLAGLGIFGFLIMALFGLFLVYDCVRVSISLIRRDMLREYVVLFALISGLIIEMALLAFNQNILRFYLWNHVAVTGFFLEVYRFQISQNSVNVDS